MNRIVSLRAASIAALVAGTALTAAPAFARQQGPVDLTATAQQAATDRQGEVEQAKPQQTKQAANAAPGDTAPQPQATSVPVIQPIPGVTPPELQGPPPPPPHWSLGDAKQLLAAIRGIGAEGLFPKDYEPTALAEAIAAGEGDALNATATRLFSWLVEDLRDGRTPMDDRIQWFVFDPDADNDPTSVVLAHALEMHDIKGALTELDPTNPDYAALKAKLAETKDPKTKALIRINMDRWRWLPQDLGLQYLITNVPEEMLRLTVNNKIITTYKTIVGKPGRTATPQLAETVQGVIFNPTWTVPQSIVKGEGLGARLLANPASARRQGYKVTKSDSGMITVVQQPGANNALGLMKLDMPNQHAIFIHDTPNRNLFDQDNRALSHGCIRTQRATELGMTMAILGADMSPEEGVEISTSGKYTRVPMSKTFPVYIVYFTYARDVNGDLHAFKDLYDRDPPVLESFAGPRPEHTGQRHSTQEVIVAQDPL
ncbi:L,D-transpeptidase family protein [Novosphingobium sp. ZN18A2]|uniref:L,D-transpeptidase family protein n=1 Tax=Novosphingobium sp. ZN18A2 TaxID=3079861 RepID=UPI0030D1685D